MGRKLCGNSERLPVYTPVCQETGCPCYHGWENLVSRWNGNVHMAVVLRCDVFVTPRATNHYFPWLLPTYQQTNKYMELYLSRSLRYSRRVCYYSLCCTACCNINGVVITCGKLKVKVHVLAVRCIDCGDGIAKCATRK